MKQTITIILSLICLSFIVADNLTQNITEAKLKIDLPNTEWFLAKKQTDTTKDYTVYFFKRNPIVDSKNRGGDSQYLFNSSRH